MMSSYPLRFFCLAALLRAASAQPKDSWGRWGDVFDMTVIPIHVILLPDAHVLSYGADAGGKQGGGRHYEVWDTTSGQHELGEHHDLLVQNADVNIFCSSLAIDITTGNILIMGGDDEENLGVNDVLEFNSETHEIHHHPKGDMHYPRWYGTAVNLPDGRIFIAGGKSGVVQLSSSIPEIWYPETGWKALPGAEIPSMTFKGRKTWWYPHVYVNSAGDLVMVIGDKRGTDVYRVGVEGDGSIQVVGKRPFLTHKLGPSIMYDKDLVAMTDEDGKLWTMDISDSSNPTFTYQVDLGPPRTNGVMSMLPDGRVLIAGGASESGTDNGNRIAVAVYMLQIWNPADNSVYTGPNQDIPRLYHSSGLILPDGSVFSAGGGSPGPLKNSNGQTYYPGYMFANAAGDPAPRPVIDHWPKNVRAGSEIRITVGDASVISKVTVTKPGSMTHSRNANARWLNLSYTVIDGTTIEVSVPDENTMIPGIWYINVIDNVGYPSEARMFGVNMVSLGGPTEAPSFSPTITATAPPTNLPTAKPTTTAPTPVPTGTPTLRPTMAASVPPTTTAPTLWPTMVASVPSPTTPPLTDILTPPSDLTATDGDNDNGITVTTSGAAGQSDAAVVYAVAVGGFVMSWLVAFG